MKKKFVIGSIVSLVVFLVLIFQPSLANESADVIKSFTQNSGDLVESFDKTRERHQILFFMGVLLLIFVLLTAGFGLAMAMKGKRVFVPHMICAGVTVFLSIAHAVVAVVWFYPFR